MIPIYYDVSCDSDLGQTHCAMASVSNENGYCAGAEADLSTGQYLENTGSYDPNDIRLFNEDGFEDVNFDKDEYQYYNIRFQNTGTDTAFTVLVLNQLSNKFDKRSFQLLSATHDVDYAINLEGDMEFRFSNILLPDSSVNQLASNGSIKYKIKPKSNIEYGDEINNDAQIFFDFNEPILTNITLAKIVKPCGSDPVVAEIDVDLCPYGSYDGYKNEGRYRDVLLTHDGCDSVRYINIIHREKYRNEVDVVKELVESGANVLAKNKKNIPLPSALIDKATSEILDWVKKQ